jgi:type I restriction-modification system DNA methylase subunit
MSTAHWEGRRAASSRTFASDRLGRVSDLNISNFIWNIADDVLRDVYVRGKYRDVILPMTVIRRLDAVLEPTKDAVLAMKAQLDKAGVANQHAALCQASGEAFYNTSQFRLRDLASPAHQFLIFAIPKKAAAVIPAAVRATGQRILR